MSRKTVSITVSVLGRALVALGFVVGAAQSCGSSGSGNSVAVCTQYCNQQATCDADAGATQTLTPAECMTRCMAQTCSNQSALVAAANACLAKSNCTDFTACAQAPTFPKCEAGGTTGSGGAGAATAGTNGSGGGSNGAGGATGSGGTTGSGGSNGTASCSTCTKAQPCCIGAFQLLGADAGACSFSAATCNGLTGASQTSYISSCAGEITAGAQLGVAACQ